MPGSGRRGRDVSNLALIGCDGDIPNVRRCGEIVRLDARLAVSRSIGPGAGNGDVVDVRLVGVHVGLRHRSLAAGA